MKRLLLLISSLLLLVSVLQAQDDYAIAGMNSNGTPIVANKYTFPEAISIFTGDVASDNVMLEFRTPYVESAFYQKDCNRGTAIYYDFENSKRLWEKTYDYTINSIYKFENVIIMNKETHSFILDEKTGKDIWEFDHYYQFPFIDTKSGKCLLYRPTGNGNITLRYFDLNSHKTLWKKNMPQVSTCRVAKKLNDSIFLLSARGIHRININNGEGWDYYAMKTKAKSERIPVYGDFTILWSGTGAMMSDSTGCVAFASVDEFLKIDNNGIILWADTLDKKNTDYSLHLRHDTLFMLSYGDADFGQYEPPVLTAYHYETGKRLYSHSVGDDRMTINTFHYNGNHLLISFANDQGPCMMKLFDLRSGEPIKQKTWETNDKALMENSIPVSKLYIKNDSALTQIFQATDDLHVVVTNENVYKVDKDLNIVDSVHFDDHYVFIYKYGGLRFFTKRNRTYVFDENDKEVAWLDFKSFSFSKTKIYTSIDNTVYAIDLNQIEGFSCETDK